MKSNKSWRTNIIAALGGAIVIIGLILVYLEKATFTEIFQAAGGIGLVLSIVSSYLAKDAKASHTFKGDVGGELPEDDDEEGGTV